MHRKYRHYHPAKSCLALLILAGCDVELAPDEPDIDLDRTELLDAERELAELRDVESQAAQLEPNATAGTRPAPRQYVRAQGSRTAAINSASYYHQPVVSAVAHPVRALAPTPTTTTVIVGQPVTTPPSPTPTAATAAATSAPGDTRYHTLQPDQTVWDIARAYDIPEDVLLAANRISYEEAKSLQPGDSLFIPGLPAEPEPSATPAPRTSGVVHQLSAGENLWSVANRYGVSAQVLMAQNSLDERSATRLAPGTLLFVPARVAAVPYSQTTATIEHVLAKNETLSEVAETYGVPTEAIMAANGLTPADLRHVQAGQELLVPGVVQSPRPVSVVVTR